MSHYIFRKRFTEYFDNKTVQTKYGIVQKKKIILNPGSRVGSHESIECWVLGVSSDLVMAFGFYQNFTENDLFCKVGDINSIQARGIGASIQFNADRSVAQIKSNDFKLAHSGSITVGNSISRDHLSNLINKLAPEIAKRFQINSKSSWPVEMGTTIDFTRLLENLFLYAFAIEQAKRSIRNEKLLPKLKPSNDYLTSLEDTSSNEDKKSGQGFSSDSILNKLIEEYAMQKAIWFYQGAGFEVFDVSAKESYDLLCKQNEQDYFIEVKGLSAKANSIIMTSNEIEKAKESYPNYELFIVENIIVNRIKSSCSNGEVIRLTNWRPQNDKCIPISYRVML